MGHATFYWEGEAMDGNYFKDLAMFPDKMPEAEDMLSPNAAHLAALLKSSNYPGIDSPG